MKAQPEQIVKPYSHLLTCPQNAKKQMSWAVCIALPMCVSIYTPQPRGEML